jgi:hypothetical protein
VEEHTAECSGQIATTRNQIMNNHARLQALMIGMLCFSSLPRALAQTQTRDLTLDNLAVTTRATGILPTIGQRYVIVEQNPADTDVQRGQKLLDAYAKAKAISRSTLTERITVFIPPGYYDLQTSGITLDAYGIDLVGMISAQITKRVTTSLSTGSGTYTFEKTVADLAYNNSRAPRRCGVVLYAKGNVIKQTVDNVRIANMWLDHRYPYGGEYTPGSGDWDTAAYWPMGSYPNTVIEHVMFTTYGEDTQDSVCMAVEQAGVAYSGTYRDCAGGHHSFAVSATGTFEDCVGGASSFGGSAPSIASGTFANCSAGTASFGGASSATGNFKNCIAEANSFGGSSASGNFENCITVSGSTLLSSIAGKVVADNLTVSAGATGVLPTIGQRYVIVEQNPADTDVQRGQKLLDAYAKAKAISRSTLTERITVFIPPGYYDLQTSGITLDAYGIDLVGMIPAQITKRVTTSVSTGSGTYTFEKTVADLAYNSRAPRRCGVMLYAKGNVIKQTVDNVRIANMWLDHRYPYGGEYTPGNGDWDTAAYWPMGSYPNTVIEHVMFTTYGEDTQDSVCMAVEQAGVAYSGTYRDCAGGHHSFAVSATGTFEDCVGADNSFSGSFPSTAGGKFLYCSGGNHSFGSGNSVIGFFKNCIAGANSFGGTSGIASGTFENCVGLDNCFIGATGNAPGNFKGCIAGAGSFNVWGGIFDQCRAGANSFQWNSASTGTAFYHCEAGTGSFGALGVASMDFNTPKGDLSMGTFTQ